MWKNKLEMPNQFCFTFVQFGSGLKPYVNVYFSDWSFPSQIIWVCLQWGFHNQRKAQMAASSFPEEKKTMPVIIFLVLCLIKYSMAFIYLTTCKSICLPWKSNVFVFRKWMVVVGCCSLLNLTLETSWCSKRCHCARWDIYILYYILYISFGRMIGNWYRHNESFRYGFRCTRSHIHTLGAGARLCSSIKPQMKCIYIYM